MSSPEPAIQFLLANAHAEEIKLVSSSLRGFFPNCRIEAVYTSDDAIAASQEGVWHIILVDQDLAPDSGVDIISRLRRNASYAAVILQTDRTDSETAIRALQSGVDFLLFKNSPAFLTELLFYVQEAIEKRDLRTKLDETFQRHLRLVETLSDLFYELDREGRFVYLSPGVTSLLAADPGYHIVRQAKEYTRGHYAEVELSLQDVALHVGLSKNHFSQVFHKVTGQTFWNYVTQLRIEKAKEMLKQGNSSNAEICRAIGSERMKVLFDIYHVQIMHGDVTARLRQHFPYVAHVHTAGVPGRNEIDDTQEMNYAPLMRTLLELGYQGYVGQEFIPARGDKIASLAQGVRICDV